MIGLNHACNIRNLWRKHDREFTDYFRSLNFVKLLTPFGKYINYVTRCKIRLHFHISSIIMYVSGSSDFSLWAIKVCNLTLLFFSRLIDVSRIAVGHCGTQLNQSALISFHKIPQTCYVFWVWVWKLSNTRVRLVSSLLI